MALKFKTSGSADDALAQLMQLAQFSQQRQEKKDAPFKSKLSDFSENISSTFDNNMIDIEIRRLDNFVANNQDSMSDSLYDEVNYIKEQAKYAKQDNSMYESMNSELDTYTNFAIENQNRYNEASPEEKLQIAKDLEGNMTKFIKAKGNMIKKFGDRLIKPHYSQDLLKLQSLDDIYLFGINSLKDGNYFDDNEKNLFSNAIVQGDMKGIDRYITQESKIRTDAATINYKAGLTELQTMNDKVSLLSKINKAKYDKYHNTAEYEAYKDGHAFRWTDPDDGSEKDYTYEELLEGDELISKLEAQYPIDLIEHEKKFNQYDKGYQKSTQGQSIKDWHDIDEMFIAPIQDDGNNIENLITENVSSDFSPVEPEVGSLQYKTQNLEEETTTKEEPVIKEDIKSEEIKEEKPEELKGIAYEYQGYSKSSDEEPFFREDESEFVDTYKLQEVPSIGYFLSNDGNRLTIDEIVKKDANALKDNLNKVMKDKRFFKGVAYGQKSGWRLKKDIQSINNLIKSYNEGKRTMMGDSIEDKIMKIYNSIIDNFMGYARDLGLSEIQKTRGLLEPKK